MLEDEDRDLQLNEQTPSLAMRLFKPLDLVNQGESKSKLTVNEASEKKNDANEELDEEAQKKMNEQLSKLIGGSASLDKRLTSSGPDQDALEESKGPPGNSASPENFMISGVKQWQKDLISDTDSQFDQIGIMDLNIHSEEAPCNLLDAPLASTIPSLGEELTTRLTPQT